MRTLFSTLAEAGGRLCRDLPRIWRRPPTPPRPTARRGPPSIPRPLERVVLTDEVSRTLFEEYAAHRDGSRGHEETGWLLLGHRQASEAVVLGTLPAGAAAEAGVAHVRFNSSGQAVGCRILLQSDRRLSVVGVVHTHPGSLRHPSDGDFEGDSAWVTCLRGSEGAFGIGTADGEPGEGTLYARHPQAHVQCLGPLRLSWYALRAGDGSYRPLPYELTLGPDLARPLHPLWGTIEAHADRLERLYQQQAKLRLETASGRHGEALALTVPLAEAGRSVRVLMEGKEVQYFLARDDELTALDCDEPRVDRGVYLLLADLAGGP